MLLAFYNTLIITIKVLGVHSKYLTVLSNKHEGGFIPLGLIETMTNSVCGYYMHI